jgi:hypothetical protein
VTRGLVEGHDGRIWVEETPGGGATFVFELPLRGSLATSPTASVVRSSDQRPVSLGERA